MKKLIIVIVALFIGGYAFADAGEQAEESSGFEHFTDEQLLAMQKDVDASFQHWRSDPIAYAKYFMKFHYPEVPPKTIKNLPAEMNIEGEEALVQIKYEGMTHNVYLYRAFPGNPKSIWHIKIMVIE